MAEFRTERKGDIIKCEYTVSGGIEGGAYTLSGRPKQAIKRLSSLCQMLLIK